jgi:peptidoglycan LD-endopeptidase LytH
MNKGNNRLYNILQASKEQFSPVIRIGKEQMVPIDLSGHNQDIRNIDLKDTEQFTKYINDYLEKKGAQYAFGGYAENREIYKRSSLFDHALTTSETRDTTQERTLHLGVDIWGPAGTPVYAPLGGMVHSFAFNNNFGDYGATIILQHQLEAITFYTLYGHLSLNDLHILPEGRFISRGMLVGHFGIPAENGHWPPHLHFQIIGDMGTFKGDYPGVCNYDERDKYLSNSPDPQVMFRLT